MNENMNEQKSEPVETKQAIESAEQLGAAWSEFLLGLKMLDKTANKDERESCKEEGVFAAKLLRDTFNDFLGRIERGGLR